MKTRKDFEREVTGLINKYQKILLLHRHTIKLVKGVDHKDSFLDCKFRYPYLDAKIGYSEDAFNSWKSGKSIENYLIHELCHIITDPLYAKATSRYVTSAEIEDERENVTDHISNIIFSLGR